MITVAARSARTDEQATTSPGALQRGWIWPTVVLALCHAQAIASFQILNILIDPIKASLSITDTQYSLLQGVAVAIFAALLGVPAARWADRRGRRNVILAGMAGWSMATVSCAFVASFGQLFLARVFVGIGEVFLFPAALSLIAGFAPERRLSTAVAIFGCGGPAGAAAALFGGGWIVVHHERITALIGWAEPLEAWRLAFFLCGISGLLTAILLPTIREPAPPQQDPLLDRFASVLVTVGQHWRTYAPLSGGMLLLATCVFATSAWTPTMLVRTYGLTYAEAGELTGAAALIGGPLLAWSAGIAVDRFHALGRRDGVMIVSLGFAIMLTLLSAAGGLLTSSAIAVAAWIIVFALLGTPTVLAGTAFQLVTPDRMRAQVMALHLVLMNVIALSLGPTLVAVVTENILRDPRAVGQSLSMLNVAASILAAAAFLFVRRRLARPLV